MFVGEERRDQVELADDDRLEHAMSGNVKEAAAKLLDFDFGHLTGGGERPGPGLLAVLVGIGDRRSGSNHVGFRQGPDVGNVGLDAK